MKSLVHCSQGFIGTVRYFMLLKTPLTSEVYGTLLTRVNIMELTLSPHQCFNSASAMNNTILLSELLLALFINLDIQSTFT